jgi:hypothetical protein
VTVALVTMQIDSIVWDTAVDTATLTLTGDDIPPPPDLPGNWYPGPGTGITITVPVKRRAVESPPTGILATTDAAGLVVYTRYEYVAGSWANPVRVNHDGSPYTG